MAKRVDAREVRLAQVMLRGRDLFTAMQALRTAAETGEKLKGIEGNPFVEAVELLRELAVNENIPTVVIGGVAGVYHGHKRYTEDMDIVISPSDYQKFLRSCHEYGFELDMKHIGLAAHIYYKGLKIEVLKGGTMTGAKEGLREIPNPAEMGVTHGLEFVPLERWVQLKIASWRPQDQIDVGKLMWGKSQAEIAAVKKYLESTYPWYVDRLDEVMETERLTRQQEERFLRGG